MGTEEASLLPVPFPAGWGVQQGPSSTSYRVHRPRNGQSSPTLRTLRAREDVAPTTQGTVVAEARRPTGGRPRSGALPGRARAGRKHAVQRAGEAPGRHQRRAAACSHSSSPDGNDARRLLGVAGVCVLWMSKKIEFPVRSPISDREGEPRAKFVEIIL